MSLDEDEFSELAANCTVPAKRALGQLEHAMLLDRHCVVQGVFVQFDALARELDPMRAPPRCTWKSFAELLLGEPALAIALLQTAIHTLLFTVEWNKSDDLKRRVVVPRTEPIQIHISGFRPLAPFRALKSNALGQFVTVRGTVVRVSGVRPIVRRMNFECARCGDIQTVAFQDGKYLAPPKCAQCKAKTMVGKRTDADSVDWQNICLQEIVENRSSGRVPRTLECEATGAMVDRCVPGDVVCISGVVKMVAADVNEKAGGRDNAKNSMYVIYVDANYVDNAHVGDEALDKAAEKSDIVEFTAKELAGIRAIMQHASPLNLIVNSLCPAIWGHELVKLGLCLALAGGVTKNSAARDKMPLRGDIHVLVVGDPGLGKCLGRDTLVLMHDGAVRAVQHVRVNDSLFGDDGTPRRVLALARGHDRLVRVTLAESGDAFVCNMPHILSLTLVDGDCRVSANGEQWHVRWTELRRSADVVCALEERECHFADECDARRCVERVCGDASVYRGGDVIDIAVCDVLKLSDDLRARLRAVRVDPDVRAHSKPRFERLRIEPAAVCGEYFGFVLDGNHRFVLGESLIVTHNSQLLRAVNALSPRGVYVSGGYSSTAGLTVTVLKEKGTGDFVLEAGALVLGDQGIAAIDEFDKMRPQHGALLEAMEQQMISIAKAGISCSLPARTSVIAAANPVDGHFDRAKTVAENLHMAAPMLSRFDMIFLLLDRADATHDMLLSEHIMNIHGAAPTQRAVSATTAAAAATTDADGEQPQVSLRDRLLPPTPFNGLPPPLLRKYICYVRRYVRPVLSPAAAAVLKDCFLRLRAEAVRAGGDAVPVTTRTLEALVRLAEARAKIEGREQVTVNDAYDIVELYEQTLPAHSTSVDAFDPLTSGMPTVFNGGESAVRRQRASLTKELKMFVQGVRSFAQRLGRRQFSTDELRSLASEGQFTAVLADFVASLEQLNMRGEFLKRRNDETREVEWQVAL